MVNLKNEEAFKNARFLKKGELAPNARWFLSIIMIIFAMGGLDALEQSAELGSIVLMVASVVVMLLAMSVVVYVNTGRRAGKGSEKEAKQ